MNALRTLVIIASGVVCAVPTVRAQSVDPLAAGSRVRIGLGEMRDVGTVVSASAHSIAYVPEDGSAVVVAESNDIESLEVSQGKRGHAGMGALIGAGAGLVLGAAFVASVQSDPWFDLEGVEAAGVIVATTMGGALLGTMIGAAIRTESWDEVGLSGRRAGMRVDVALTLPLGR